MKKTEKCSFLSKIAAAGLGVLLCLAFCAAVLPMSAQAEEKKVSYLYAMYTGETLAVGEEIDRGKIEVTAIFEDGTSEEIFNFALSTDRVMKDGVNVIHVVYRGKSCEITVFGKKAQSLYVQYLGGPVSIGNSVSRDEIMVNVVFSDGSYEEITDYQLGNHVINTSGTQKVQVVYGGLQGTFDVVTMPEKSISGLYASYEGEHVLQGNPIPSKYLYVTAFYPDGTTERIHNYTVSPAKLEDLGTNTVYIIYRGHRAELKVECVVKTLESLTVTYRGGKVAIGDYVDYGDIIVKARYDDGYEEIVEDYELLSGRILQLGNNTVTVSYCDMKASFVVQGVKEIGVNYANAASFSITNKVRTADVKIALPSRYSNSMVTGKSLKPERVASVLSKLESEIIDYIAFNVLLEDETRDDIFPLTMQIKLPSYYKMTQTHLYYSANRRTVIAGMNITMVDSRTIEVSIFHPGTYILTYEELPPEDKEDKNKDDDYL